jgi:phenylacetate-CoA ligase
MQQTIYDMLMKSQFWTRSQLVDYQHTQLSQLLQHAKEKVPFYKERLSVVLSKNGSFNWDRWQDLPILTRKDLVEHRETMQATELPEGYGAPVERWSSGTTGVPVTITVNGLAGIAAIAGTMLIGRSPPAITPLPVLAKRLTLTVDWTVSGGHNG